MARRRPTNAISLFPFLAVLVCTMGALILLLLVTTRRIRNDQQQVAAQIDRTHTVESSVSEKPNEPATEATPPTVETVLSPQPTGNDADFVDLTIRLDQIAKLKRDIAQAKGRQQDIQERLRRLRQQQDEQRQRRQQHENLRQELARLETDFDAMTAVLQDQRRLLSQAEAELAEQARLTEAGERLLRQRESALIRLRKLSAEIAARADHGTDQTVLEFSNREGTRTAPIIVEVTDDGFLLQPTEVRITEADMLGFPASDNPLLAVLFAVNDYRNPSRLHQQPYVLLLVRPDGSLPFYVAQRTLNEAGVHFGYELLSADRSIRFDAQSAEEQQVARQALLAALKRRKDVYGLDMARLNDLRQKAERARQVREQSGQSAGRPDDIPRERFSAGAPTPPPVASLVGQWQRPNRSSDRAGRASDADRGGTSTELSDRQKAAADGSDGVGAAEPDPFPPLVQNDEFPWSEFDVAAEHPVNGLPGEAANPDGGTRTVPEENRVYDEAQFFGVPSHIAQGHGPKQSSRESLDGEDRTTFSDSDRTAPPADFGRPDRSSADLSRGTRTAKSAEDSDGPPPSPGGPSATRSSVAASPIHPDDGSVPAGPGALAPHAEGNFTDAHGAAGGQPPASASQDFLSRFLSEVEREQEKRKPNPVLLALLRHAEARTTAANSFVDSSGTGRDQQPWTDSDTGVESAMPLRLTLTAQDLKIQGGSDIDLHEKTVDDLVKVVLESAQTNSIEERRAVAFRVSRAMLPIQQRLSKELAKHSIATSAVELLEADQQGQPADTDDGKQLPAEPRSGRPPRRSERGVSL